MRSIPLLRRLGQGSKTSIKRLTPDWVLSRARPNAIRTVTGAKAANPGDPIPLYAIVCTWMEEDIIYSSVRNAFALGADQVFLLDNGSTDRTVAEATDAGATHVLTFHTKSFDEIFKYRMINEYIELLSRESDHDRIWWLMMDADEFVRAPDGGALTEFLSEIDVRCRVVGSRVLDHFPAPGVNVEPRSDPMAAQPMCREKIDHRCELGHHKHPVFLWSKALKRIVVEPGFHQLQCRGEALFEPPISLVLDHFPFRDESVTLKRLELLAERGSTAETSRGSADTHMRARLASLRAVYDGAYDQVIDYRTGERGLALSTRDEILQRRAGGAKGDARPMGDMR